MAESAGGWGNDPGGSELWRLIGDAFGRAAASDPRRSLDPEICSHPIREELRDAHNDHFIRPGQA